MSNELELYKALHSKYNILGVDEVGYGCLAGPLVVVGVRAVKNWSLDGLNDSKKLSEKKRNTLRDKLEFNKEIVWYKAERSSVEIDRDGVAVALKSAYVEVFHKLYQEDTLIISDGILKFDNLGVDAYDKFSVIKADAKFPTVMAASILAKTYRDALMKKLDPSYPVYNWKSNVGYGSKDHLEAIAKYGPCAFHRMSYAPMKNMKQ